MKYVKKQQNQETTKGRNNKTKKRRKEQGNKERNKETRRKRNKETKKKWCLNGSDDIAVLLVGLMVCVMLARVCVFVRACVLVCMCVRACLCMCVCGVLKAAAVDAVASKANQSLRKLKRGRAGE